MRPGDRRRKERSDAGEAAAEANGANAMMSPGNPGGPATKPLDGTASEPFLAAGEPAAFEIVNPEGAGSAVLVCDHASNRLPLRLGTLGLSAAERADHIAWDPGAAEVAHRLSELLDAPLVLSNYSRLVIDCNRPLDSPESIPAHSDGVPVPGNRLLTAAERVRRIEALFEPYHHAIGGVLDRRAGRPSLLLSIHSFTRALVGQRQRPWAVGFGYGRDRRLVALMLDAMRCVADTAVGDNQPYPVEDSSDYTIPVHGENRGLPHALVEFRQDGITTPAGATAWAMRLAEAFRRIEPAALRLG